MSDYKVCNRCVMDNYSDDKISFDEQGFCNYCSVELERSKQVYFPNEEGKTKLNEIIKKIKQDGVGKDYDCLMGISGGLDSAYLAYLGSKWGLRILAVHIDDGYDTDIAKSNIKNLCAKLDIKLLIEKPDKEQFNDITKSYIFAEVPNLAAPQDNILFACLYQLAKTYKVKYFLSGGNFALESILQQGNTHTAYDLTNLKNIAKVYGTKGIDKLPLMSLFDKGIVYKYLYKIETLRLLNYINYNRENVIELLKKECGFEYYGSKHTENELTKFTQLIWLPKKFNVDKRRSHFSSMIVSGQMTREQALKYLEEPIIGEEDESKCIQKICEGLDIQKTTMLQILGKKGKQHSDYKTSLFDRIVVKTLHK